MTTLEITEADILHAVEQTKREIIRDAVQGVVDAEEVSNFGELNAYVDANTYGGMCDTRADWPLETVAVVQDRVDSWLGTRPLRALRRHLESRSDLSEARVAAITRQSECANHVIDVEHNHWCQSCDTGECPDCFAATFYYAADGWYHHFEPTGGCFLIGGDVALDA